MSSTLADEDIRMIEERSKTYAQAVQDNDSSAATALFTEDAVRYPPNQPTVTGHADMERWLSSLPRRRVFRTHPIEIRGFDDLAYARGSYEQEMILEGSPDPVADHGNYLEIWRKLPDGKWYIAVLSHNSDNFDLVMRFLGASNASGS